MALIGFDVDRCLLFEGSLIEILIKLIFRRKKSNERMIRVLIYLKEQGHELFAISSRSRFLKWFTIKQIRKNCGLFFKKIICTGGILNRQRAERKFKVISRENIDLFVDNNAKIVDFIFDQGISAFISEEFLVIFKKLFSEV